MTVVQCKPTVTYSGLSKIADLQAHNASRRQRVVSLQIGYFGRAAPPCDEVPPSSSVAMVTLVFDGEEGGGAHRERERGEPSNKCVNV